MNAWLKIFTFAISLWEGFREWNSKRKKEAKINAIDRTVDSPSIDDDAKLLSEFAERVRRRKKSS